ncbi:AMP-binding protein, partial [Campylobacter jejuni]|nr:AMP-binding protein [Campylobacter jejuni]
LKNINLLNSTTANIIGIIGDYDFESISLLLACIELNKIIIPFVDEKEIENKLKEVRCDLVFNNGEIILKNDGSVNHPLVDRLIKENKSGLILFSSGSTGKPKAIIHDLYKIIQNIQFDNKHNIVISLFLPDHVAGIDVLLKTLSSNSTLVIVSKREVGVILKSIELYKVNIMPISPSMLRLILLGEVDKYNLESIEVIA